jgi:hypothetical protein
MCGTRHAKSLGVSRAGQRIISFVTHASDFGYSASRSRFFPGVTCAKHAAGVSILRPASLQLVEHLDQLHDQRAVIVAPRSIPCNGPLPATLGGPWSGRGVTRLRGHPDPLPGLRHAVAVEHVFSVRVHHLTLDGRRGRGGRRHLGWRLRVGHRRRGIIVGRIRAGHGSTQSQAPDEGARPPPTAPTMPPHVPAAAAVPAVTVPRWAVRECSLITCTALL